MSVWNPDNIRDVAESVGVPSLGDDVVHAFSSDVEYRLSQVLEQALRFMRHAKRTTLFTQDISQALRVLNVEPLYGYESTRPLRFGEASIGPGQPLFYVEDEEVDFEKLINAPLPKVPREMSFTAHWLAVEGVQPSIPQNPTSADSRNQELVPKGSGANANLSAISGNDNVTVKPLVKHVLSKELQLYFEKIATALLDESNEEYRIAALASLRSDPGLHQLVPYFVQYIAEKVTHQLKDLFILTQMMQLTSAMLDNESLYVDPYVASIIPPVLTCLVGSRLGSDANRLAHYPLRNLASSILGLICKKYSKSSSKLRPRLCRTFLKNFLDPLKSFAVHYGAIIGLSAVGGKEVVRVIIMPNLKEYGKLLQEAFEQDLPSKVDAEMVVGAILGVLETLKEDRIRGVGGGLLTNGQDTEMDGGEGDKEQKVREKLGDFVGGRVLQAGKMDLVDAVLED